MIVGTIAEHTFSDAHLVPLEFDGFKVVDYVGAGENLDFGAARRH